MRSDYFDNFSFGLLFISTVSVSITVRWTTRLFFRL